MAKIIFIGSAHPFRGGGLTTFNERLSRELISLGHDVEIYTFTVQYPSFLFPGKTQFTDAPPPSDLKILRKVNSVNPLNWISVGNEIRKKKPDILLYRFWLPFMGACFGSISRRVRKNHYTKVLSIVDNVIPHERRPGDILLTKYFLNTCDGFLTMSSAVAADLRRRGFSRHVVQSPHPLYDNYGEPVSREAALAKLNLDLRFQYILFFGFIRKYKGLDLLLEAFADKRLKNLKLLVAGEFYEDSKPYLDLISKLKLKDRVIMKTEFIPDDEVKYYFSAAEVVVQPYRSATQSGVTQVAYQFNKPMIVTNVGGLPELVIDGKTGLVVELKINSISEGILRFFKEKLTERFEKEILEEKKRFSWTSFAKEIMNLSVAIGKQ